MKINPSLRGFFTPKHSYKSYNLNYEIVSLMPAFTLTLFFLFLL
jgi:hypothetical protein